MKLIRLGLVISALIFVVEIWLLGTIGIGWGILTIIPVWIILASHVPNCGNVMSESWDGEMGWRNFKDTLGFKIERAYCGSCVLRNGDKCKVPVVSYDALGPVKMYPLIVDKNKMNLCSDYLQDYTKRMEQLIYEKDV